MLRSCPRDGTQQLRIQSEKQVKKGSVRLLLLLFVREMKEFGPSLVSNSCAMIESDARNPPPPQTSLWLFREKLENDIYPDVKMLSCVSLSPAVVLRGK